MQKYNIPFIPYDKNLVSRARELRKETTKAEKLFWDEILKSKKFVNFKFTRQKPLDHFIVDFYCAKLCFAVEIDGEIHDFQKIRDKERDSLLKQKFGLQIIRYTNKEVLTNTEKVIDDLTKKIQRVASKVPLIRGI
ncbi:hypothetical protein A2356_03750 [Candidatus Nomurabacteria bacterium RIFOXYB1_FULL_39_16]|uniref:DUF559 domain-containing protein n=2 Tax=Candidatus Nomuraibacteriota TaxID=1752729 RepID=A0A0G0QWV4_9BACT|nr:MAG: hypothetical protein UT78_C0019G0011 [Candidatus Nomurabacteria bacterium GW2011_GWF2_40_12]OGJ09195.1 MAG: hypothetical protein A2356_03750 [Candidatus Nomurabacteria bacterium RIFOXYB1_FULL_39_16]OGJ15103.1 MAG: hypothetical protein A2585_00700 [Candidatus Nomurabacteria bacterium RIFOXYD1_FULL_39_12]